MSTGADKMRCGKIAIIGKPNVGKSTLLNALIQQKISITAPKAQTTRYSVLGIKTAGMVQAIFIDTPGIHHVRGRNALHRAMNRQAFSALQAFPDVVVFVLDRLQWTTEDESVLAHLSNIESPVVLVVNKVDKLNKKELLLPHLVALNQKRKFADIVPLSAQDGTNLETLEKVLYQYLPEGPHIYPEDELTNRNLRFMAAEFIREKLVRFLNQELPHATAVEIEHFKEEEKLYTIDALIWVEKPGQKPIVIGEKGLRLKEIGRLARLDMERLFGRKVYLRLWVKVKPDWSDDQNALRKLAME